MIKFFQKKKEPENLEEIIKDFTELRKEFSAISERLKKLEKKFESAIQKIGVIRFNPFKEAGGDQSFSIAFLDEKNNGVVVTSLYGRENNKVFSKPIANGTSNYILSEEEKKAIEKAKEIKPNQYFIDKQNAR